MPDENSSHTRPGAPVPRRRSPLRACRADRALTLCAGLIVGAFLAGAPAIGQETCVTTLCLAGLQQTGGVTIAGGPTCQLAVCAYFATQVWDPKYDPSATEKLRWTTYLAQCPAVATAQAVDTAFGTIPMIPACAVP